MVPRTKLVDVLRQVYAIADEQRLTMMNVFHAGDGNLHPLIVFDAREPGVWERVHRAGDEILAACVAAGRRAVGRARHRAREARGDAAHLLGPTTSTPRPACATRSIPSARANPQKILPRGSRCGELQRVPEGAWI